MCTPLVVVTSVAGAGGWERARAEGQGEIRALFRVLVFFKNGEYSCTAYIIQLFLRSNLKDISFL